MGAMTPPRLVRLRLGLARAQGVLFLGPEFNHGVGAVEPEAVFAAIQHKLTDRSNFEALSLDDRLTLAAQALDEEGLARAVGDARAEPAPSAPLVGQARGGRAGERARTPHETRAWPEDAAVRRQLIEEHVAAFLDALER